MFFYSPTTRGFYTREIHGDSVPSDSVEVSTEKHEELIAAQGLGKEISTDSDGNPIAIDPIVSDEQKKIILQKRAIMALEKSDVSVIRTFEEGKVLTKEFIDYRETLRSFVRGIAVLDDLPLSPKTISR